MTVQCECQLLILLQTGEVAVARTCRNYPDHPTLAAEDLPSPAAFPPDDDARRLYGYSHPPPCRLAPVALAVRSG